MNDQARQEKEVTPAEIRPAGMLKVLGRGARQPKDLDAIIVSMTTFGCYREHKYRGMDQRRKCHWGLDAMDPDRCVHCIHWFEVPGAARKKLLTGDEAGKMADFLMTLDPAYGGRAK